MGGELFRERGRTGGVGGGGGGGWVGVSGLHDG